MAPELYRDRDTRRKKAAAKRKTSAKTAVPSRLGDEYKSKRASRSPNTPATIGAAKSALDKNASRRKAFSSRSNPQGPRPRAEPNRSQADKREFEGGHLDEYRRAKAAPFSSQVGGSRSPKKPSTPLRPPSEEVRGRVAGRKAGFAARGKQRLKWAEDRRVEMERLQAAERKDKITRETQDRQKQNKLRGREHFIPVDEPNQRQGFKPPATVMTPKGRRAVGVWSTKQEHLPSIKPGRYVGGHRPPAKRKGQGRSIR